MSGTATTAYAANDASILYSPYTWGFTTVSGYAFAVTVNGGSRLRFQFNAAGLSSLVLNFYQGQATNNRRRPGSRRIWIRVDDGPWQIAQVANSAITCALPSWSASWPVHTVELRVRSIPTAVSRWVPASAGLPPPAACAFTGYSASPRRARAARRRRSRKRRTCWSWATARPRRGSISRTPKARSTRPAARTGWTPPPAGPSCSASSSAPRLPSSGRAASASSTCRPPACRGWASSWNYLWQGQARTFSPVPDLLVFMVRRRRPARLRGRQLELLARCGPGAIYLDAYKGLSRRCRRSRPRGSRA